MVSVVEKSGIRFVCRKPAKQGTYLCVDTVDLYAKGLTIGPIQTAFISENWTLRSVNLTVNVERWLTRSGHIRKDYKRLHFSEKTIEELLGDKK